MNDLDEIYKRLARDWPSKELAARYASARDHGARGIKNHGPLSPARFPWSRARCRPPPRWTSPSTCFTC